MAITEVVAGSPSQTIGSNPSTSPSLPSGCTAADLLVILDVVVTQNSTPAIPSTPTGWTRRDTFAAGDVRVTWFYRPWQSGLSAPTISVSGASTTQHRSIMARLRGGKLTGDPTDVLGAQSSGTSASTMGPIDGVTTTVAGTALLMGVGRGNDLSDGTTIGALAPFIALDTWGSGSGENMAGGFAYQLLANPTTVGDDSFSISTASSDTWAGQMWAIAPEPSLQEEARTGSSVTGTATSVSFSQAQAEARTVTAETGTVTSVAHTTLQLEARSVTAETGVTASVAESVQHTADADADTGTATSVAESVHHFADADTVTGTSTTASFSRESVQLPATGPLFFDFWVIDPATGAYVAPLPDYASAEVAPVFGEPGAVRIDYPFDGANYGLLRDGVTHQTDLEIAIWVGGRKDREMRALLQESDADVVAEQGLHRFGGHFLEILLAEMVVLPNPANEKQETVFNAVTAGEIVEWLVDAAHAEGYLDGITTATFSASTDSNGTAWGDTIGNLVLSPGASYAEVLAELDNIGAAEWDITPARELRLFKWGTRGTDRTVQTPPIILRRGRHITDAARKTSVRDAGTDVLMSGKEGLYTRISDATAVANRGRRILRYESANNVADAGALSAVAQAQLQVTTAGALELTHGLSFGPDDPLPISDYDLGDWVGSDTGNPDVAFERLRVRQWSFAEDENGEITGGISLNYLFVDQTERLRRRLNRLVSGGAVVGTSEPPGEGDTLAPAAPTGVTVDSLAYKQGLDTYATLIVGWAAVTTNSDGTAATDVAGYRVEWRHEADPAGQWQLGADVTTTSAQFGGVGSGVDVRVRVAAYDRDGNVSAWSAEVLHLTETDTTPPPVPSTPVVSNYLGVLLCEWDGLGSAGEAMPVDFSHVEVHMSTAAGFTPDATTYVDRLFAAGSWPVADLPYGVEHFFRLVAVDRTLPAPNKSAASGVGSATPGQVVSADVFDGAIGSAKLADLAVTTAKINDLAVNDAKIGDLSVGKLTAGTFSASMTLSGIIRTALSGARVEIDNAGVRLYNSGGTATIDLNAATGSALVSGEYRSAQSGTRFIINSGGINPDEMRFYPSSGSQYGTINTVTSNSVDFGVQTGLSIKAHSGRVDGFSGQLQAFPDYASMSWGETSIQTVPQQIGIGAPRLHFAAFRNSNHAVGDDEMMRFGIVDRNNPPNFITASVIEYLVNGSGEPYWRSFHNNSGVLFAPNNVGAIAADSSGYIQHRASAHDEFTSSRDSKTAFAALAFDDGTRGALGACRRAQPEKWKRINEVERDGDGARTYIGAMADDLPPEVVVHDERLGLTGISLSSLIGLVHGGLNELADAVDTLTARVAALETRTPRGGP